MKKTLLLAVVVSSVCVASTVAALPPVPSEGPVPAPPKVVAPPPAGTLVSPRKSSAGKPSIEHTYAVTGKGDTEKSNYAGTATIAKIGGDMYNGTWHIGTNTFKGVGFRDGDFISFAWAVKPNGLGVVSYLVGKSELDGVWFQTGGTRLGVENLQPASSTAKAFPKVLDGPYTIAKGQNPDGSKYSGSMVLAAAGDTLPGVERATWHIGSSTVKGLALRSRTPDGDDVVTAGFDTGGDYGILAYAIDASGNLSGRWVQSIGGKITIGTETLKQGN